MLDEMSVPISRALAGPTTKTQKTALLPITIVAPYVSASLRLTNPRAHTTSPPPGKCHIFASVRPSAAHSAATSSSSCAAESATRSRLVPGGTVGGRIAGT